MGVASLLALVVLPVDVGGGGLDGPSPVGSRPYRDIHTSKLDSGIGRTNYCSEYYRNNNRRVRAQTGGRQRLR
eukprot:6213699-Pleurochrysis_carterae.AAC.3